MPGRGIHKAVTVWGLSVVGAFHPQPGDSVPEGVETIYLLGACNERMWKMFEVSAEAADGQADPLDRWSRRIIEAVATDLGAVAIFPFGGPPHQPFQRWALRGENAVPSPVSMQVTPGRGLWTSYRGALGFRETIALERPDTTNPCPTCPAPCLTACPVDAFSGGTYHVPRCVAHITPDAGAPCRKGGCLVRHACPAGRAAVPPKEQRRFHMEAFIRAKPAGGDDQ